MISTQTMPFFSTLDDDVKQIALDKLAYELLDNYMEEEDEYWVESRLMEGLSDESRPFIVETYDKWVDYRDKLEEEGKNV